MKLNLLLVLLLISNNYFSQVNSEFLDFNSTSALLLDEGVLFKTSTAGTPSYEVPKGSGKNVIFSGAFWIAGIDQDGILRNACAKFNNGRDFFSGPYSITDLYTDPDYLSNYDEAIWTVTKSEIEYHIANYSEPGYIIPTSIQAWPGNGNTALGVSENLAPFIDSDGDNIYEPQNGEHPDIRGDKASYIIMNDDADIHTESLGNPMGIEIHIMAFQFISNDFLDSTTFLNLRLFNRGSYIYNNLKVGFYLDGDIGGYSDDFYGCDSLRNLIYTYNGDNFDESVSGYGDNPPAMGVLSLSHNMNVAGFFTSGDGYPHSDPDLASQYWRYMNGRWADGDYWYYGGKGYTGSLGVTTNPTTFMMTGNPYTGEGWSELTNNNPPGDRRMFMVLDSMEFNTSSNECFDFAIVYSRQGDYLENVQGVIATSDSVKQFFDAQPFNCVQVTADLNEISKDAFRVYPNPNNGEFTIEFSDLTGDYHLSITDCFGKEIRREIISGTTKINSGIKLENGIYFLSLINSENIIKSTIRISVSN